VKKHAGRVGRKNHIQTHIRREMNITWEIVIVAVLLGILCYVLYRVTKSVCKKITKEKIDYDDYNFEIELQEGEELTISTDAFNFVWFAYGEVYHKIFRRFESTIEATKKYAGAPADMIFETGHINTSRTWNSKKTGLRKYYGSWTVVGCSTHIRFINRNRNSFHFEFKPTKSAVIKAERNFKTYMAINGPLS
jgi:hypothetical protein